MAGIGTPKDLDINQDSMISLAIERHVLP